MKTLAFLIFFTFSLVINAQTTNNTSNSQAIELEKIEQADLTISIPMIGQVTLKNCDQQLQKDLKPLTILKVVEIDSLQFFELVQQHIEPVSTIVSTEN
jgi:hypothetical protein